MNRKLHASYYDDNLVFFNKTLNLEQTKSVRAVLNEKDYPTCYCVHGPPGTGKTVTLVESIMHFLLRKKRVLVASTSNAAVDNLALRIQEKAKEYDYDLEKYYPIRIGSMFKTNSKLNHIKIDNLDPYNEKTEIKERIKSLRKKESDLLSKLHNENNQEKKDSLTLEYSSVIMKIAEAIKNHKDANKKILKKSNLVFCTLLTDIISFLEEHTNERGYVPPSLQKIQEINNKKELSSFSWDVLIIDEASQSKFVECILPMRFSKRVIFAGDHKQLPPFYRTKKAKELQGDVSLFESLIFSGVMPEIYTTLRTQFRMNSKIMAFPSSSMYGNRLIADKKNASLTLRTVANISHLQHTNKHLMAFLNTELFYLNTNDETYIDYSYFCRETTLEGTTSLTNRGEALLIALTVSNLLVSGIKPEDIGIITGYRQQVNVIYKELFQELIRWYSEKESIRILDEIEYETVDSFQGREKEVILISLVRQHQLGFYSDLKRMNVAITRSKKQLILIGNIGAFKENHNYYKKLHDTFYHTGYNLEYFLYDYIKEVVYSK